MSAWYGVGMRGTLPSRLPHAPGREDLVELTEVVLAGLPLGCGRVAPHLLRLGGPGDHGRHGRLRGEAADGHVDRLDASRLGVMGELLEAVEGLVIGHLRAATQARALGGVLAAPILAGQE